MPGKPSLGALLHIYSPRYVKSDPGDLPERPEKSPTLWGPLTRSYVWENLLRSAKGQCMKCGLLHLNYFEIGCDILNFSVCDSLFFSFEALHSFFILFNSRVPNQ